MIILKNGVGEVYKFCIMGDIVKTMPVGELFGGVITPFFPAGPRSCLANTATRSL
jgi:hypothetical protein